MRTEIRTLTDDHTDLHWEAKFLGALLAIPLAGVFGLPLLLLLLLLFLLNPGGLGECVAQMQCLRKIPGFRSGQRARMAAACLLYLLPISFLGIVVVGVDGMVLGLIP